MPALAAPAETVRLESCPACGGSRFKQLATPGHWIGPEVFGHLEGRLGLVQCRGCGLRFTNPRPAPELLDRFYSGETYVCHESGGSSSAGPKADFLLDRIGRTLAPATPRVLLDYGCGGGGFLRHARTRGWDVTGYEPGRRGLESTRASGIDATDELDSLPRGRYSVITLHSVFEHVPDPVETLAGIRPLLAPGGVLFVQVPNAGALRARLAFPFLSRHWGADERHRAFPIHLAYYTRRTLGRVMAAAGWTVADSFTVGMGIDEFWIRPDRPAETTRASTAAPHRKRRLRHLIRDAFLGLGLGESLAVVARPHS